MTTIELVDTTLRDGQQCLWATRMTTAMMAELAAPLDRAGFQAIELMGAVQFDAAVRYLADDPWQRLRFMRERVTRTPLQAVIRSKCVLGFDLCADDIAALWAERLFRNGAKRFVLFDGLHDLDNLAPAFDALTALGAHATGWLTFSDSPVHTDDLYVAKAREFIDRFDADALMIEDASGILTPERVRSLAPKLRAAIGNRPLGLHSHGLIGLPQRTQLAAVECGVDHLYTALPPLADGAAPPSVITTIRNLRDAGAEVNIDDTALYEAAGILEATAHGHGKPIGRPADYDASYVRHQIPGGVLSNLTAQLADAGLEDKLDAVLDESVRLRGEIGWPIQVTPFAQFIGVQATLNVIQGERYAVVPDEIKKYALGHYGKLLAPVDPDVLDRIVERGSPDITLEPPVREPVLPWLRKQYPAADDDELLLRYFFDAELIERLNAGPTGDGSTLSAATPLHRLLEELARRPPADLIVVEKPGFRLELTGPASACSKNQ